MSGSTESSSPFVPEVPAAPSANVFTPTFLRQLAERDEPPSADEADMAGPWLLREVPGGGFGVFRSGETRPYAVFASFFLARLAAAILPGTGREPLFHLDSEPDSAGFAVDSGGEVVGHLSLFDDRVIAALHTAESLVRSPEALANLLEAAGSLALGRSGAILDGRYPDPAA